MLPAGATLRVIGDGRIGHEVQGLGLAEALGAVPDFRRIAPRRLFDWLAPIGPMDPHDAVAVAPPWPDIAIAAGRRTLPALRRLKRASGGRTFTIYINRPLTGLGAADLIIAPRHDSFDGPNVLAPLTPPNRITPERLAAARRSPHPQVARLPHPRAALLIGDASGLRYDPCAVAETLFADGFAVMATASRRTPAPLAAALQRTLACPGGFFWDSTGENPYLSILANADRIVVTGDSVNMIGEAAATGAPVHVLPASRPRRRIARYLAALEEAGLIAIWDAPLPVRPSPRNETPEIARQIAAAWRAARAGDDPDVETGLTNPRFF